jgi:CubicO group peptidase (beta-lactamase class C family)
MQKEVQSTVDQLVESGAERGIQVAVYRNGEQVVDAVAGIADPTTGRPGTSATPFYNYSICKAATATLVHQLAERGTFTYDRQLRWRGPLEGTGFRDHEEPAWLRLWYGGRGHRTGPPTELSGPA